MGVFCLSTQLYFPVTGRHIQSCARNWFRRVGADICNVKNNPSDNTSFHRLYLYFFSHLLSGISKRFFFCYSILQIIFIFHSSLIFPAFIYYHFSFYSTQRLILNSRFNLSSSLSLSVCLCLPLTFLLTIPVLSRMHILFFTFYLLFGVGVSILYPPSTILSASWVRR